MTGHPTIHEPGDVRRQVQHRGHGHACPQCEGVGTVRLRGRPGGDRRPCPSCAGSGQLRAAR